MASCSELESTVRRAIDRIDPDVGAFITVDDTALARAREAPTGPLTGLVGAVKDLIDTVGLRTTRGSSIYVDRVPSRSASIVSGLEQAGLISIGKTNLNEFAYGVSGHNPHFGIVHDPRDRGRTAGGSSGGSAAAVAMGACDVGVGTDTSGSIRIPAACCGVYGFKAAHGAYPTDGVFPLATSFDSLGFLAADATTLSRVLGIAPTPAGAKIRLAREGQDLELPPLPGEHWSLFRREAQAVHRDTLARWPERYGADVRRKLALEVGDVEAAPKVMAGWRAAVIARLEGVDVVEGEVFGGGAPTVEEAMADYRDGTQLVADRLLAHTPVANALGWPAMTVPTSAGPRHLLARPGDEAHLLAVAERRGLSREDVLEGVL